jgi:hypothetical protein
MRDDHDFEAEHRRRALAAAQRFERVVDQYELSLFHELDWSWRRPIVGCSPLVHPGPGTKTLPWAPTMRSFVSAAGDGLEKRRGSGPPPAVYTSGRAQSE